MIIGIWLCIQLPNNGQETYGINSIFSGAQLFRIQNFFLLLDWLSYLGKITKSAQLFTHNWRENSWINTFPKGISTMWNTIKLIQDLNSGSRVYFQWL